MIRILHTADWHLGQSFFGYDRTDEHLHFLDWLCDTIRQHEVDVLIIAGDVFDVSNPSAASQRMFYRFVSRVTTENPALQLVVGGDLLVAFTNENAGVFPFAFFESITEHREEWLSGFFNVFDQIERDGDEEQLLQKCL